MAKNENNIWKIQSNVLYLCLKRLFERLVEMSTKIEKCHQNHQNHAQTSSYERLLDSAEKIFSQKGFSGTTVRDIITDAKCNIAAINYHFGSKEKLYFEVYSHLMVKLRQERITSIEKVMSDKHDEALLEKLLLSFAHAFVNPLSSKNEMSSSK